MKIIAPCLVMLLVLLSAGCNAEISGTVVDAETGSPIEGAIVLIQWTMTKGFPGMTRHETYKVIEIYTNRDGNFSAPEIFSSSVNKPEIVICKEGYISWRNDLTFPDWEKRKSYNFSEGSIIRLEKFKKELSHYDHYRFLSHGIIGASYETTPMFMKVLDYELQKGLNIKR